MSRVPKINIELRKQDTISRAYIHAYIKTYIICAFSLSSLYSKHVPSLPVDYNTVRNRNNEFGNKFTSHAFNHAINGNRSFYTLFYTFLYIIIWIFKILKVDDSRTNSVICVMIKIVRRDVDRNDPVFPSIIIIFCWGLLYYLYLYLFWWGGHCCPMHCDLLRSIVLLRI